MSTNRLWVSFLIIVLVEGWLSECCWNKERDALLHLKAQFQDLPSDWVDGSDCCLWKNVECNNTTRQVSKLTLSESYGNRYGSFSDHVVHLSDFHVFKALESLDLSYNIIAGFAQNKGNERLSWPSSLEVIDLSHNRLRIDTVSSFSDLKCLKQLNLSGNLLIGSLDINGNERLPWPSSLEVLDLSYNNLRSDIVSSFGDMKCLKQLNLSVNMLEGYLDISGNERLSWPSSLEILDLSHNYLRNDTVSSFSDLKCLKQLKLSGSMLEGYLNISEVLDLSENKISGFVVNQGWSKLKKLEQLYLRQNWFEGSLPSSFANLTSLRSLDISSNSFTENPAFTLASLTSLEFLDFSDNYFNISASLTFLANYSNLKFNNGSGNKITPDPYPTIQNWVPNFQLQVFQLSSTSETSFLPFPNFLVHQYGLTLVDLRDTDFGREFPKWLMENNTQLETFILRNCFFSSHIQFPWHPLPKISLIDMSHNAITGQIPVNNISSIFPNLEYLYMSRNAFSGLLPHEFGMMMGSLRELDVSYNSISGEIPRSLSIGESSLIKFILSNNKFQGDICPSLATFNGLKELFLDGNNFSGSVEGCFNSTRLVRLDISNNNFEGKLPTNVLGSTDYRVESILMATNNFEGSIPINFFELPSLLHLDLSENNLSGSLPSFGPYLSYVHLSNNKFHGLTTKMFNESTYLTLLDLSYNDITGHLQDIMGNNSLVSILFLKGNHLTGQIPYELWEFRNLAILDLSNNKLSGSIPKCLGNISFDSSTVVYNPRFAQGFFWATVRFKAQIYKEVQQVNFTTKKRFETYKGDLLFYMSGMDLSDNELKGNIPLELENLTNIRSINLSHNHLSGEIPTTFSNLKHIESLDLSFNRLTGEIPPQLTKLTFLAVFSLAYNNLSGRTPETKNQFITFDEGSYEGNPFLCGPPLNRSCSDVDRQPHDNDKHENDGFMDVPFFCQLCGVLHISHVGNDNCTIHKSSLAASLVLSC